MIQSCCVLRKTGSELVFLKAAGCNLQKDFPSSSDSHARGPGQRAGGAMWIMARHGARQPCQTTTVETQGSVPQALLVCAGSRGSSAAVCRAVLVCLPAAIMDVLRPELSVHSCRTPCAAHTPSVPAQPPQRVQRAPKGSSCPVLHIIGLTGLFSDTLSVCQGKGLSRHDVKPTSFKTHSALGVITNPGEVLSIKHFPCRRVKKICSG